MIQRQGAGPDFFQSMSDIRSDGLGIMQKTNLSGIIMAIGDHFF
jgi:hypothetical protein